MTERDTRKGPAGEVRDDKGATPPAALSALDPVYFFTTATLAIAVAAVVLLRGRPLAEMSLAVAIVASAGLAAFALYRTLLPFAAPAGDELPPLVGGRTRAALERDKVLTLRAIKELEFDRAMGKVSEADFAEMRTRLRARALRLMQQLDERTPYREAIERDLGALLASSTGREETAAGAAPLCGDCGAMNETDARFCKMCGHALRP